MAKKNAPSDLGGAASASWWKRLDRNSQAGVVGVLAVGLAVGFILFVVAIEKQALGFVGLVVGIGLVAWGAHAAHVGRQAEKQAQLDRAEEAARAKRLWQAGADLREKAGKLKQKRIQALGAANAALVESAEAAVKRVADSEAARAGWLGDVDFSDDIRGIIDTFLKAHSLRKVAAELSGLDQPTPDDRKILQEASTAADNLSRVAAERVTLIEKCAAEAEAVDKSLRKERADAHTAEQRARLHAKLSSMLYGIEATPDTGPRDSTADAVIARVGAYREIKHQIQQSRGG
jgi:hypothetical protein